MHSASDVNEPMSCQCWTNTSTVPGCTANSSKHAQRDGTHAERSPTKKKKSTEPPLRRTFLICGRLERENTEKDITPPANQPLHFRGRGAETRRAPAASRVVGQPSSFPPSRPRPSIAWTRSPRAGSWPCERYVQKELTGFPNAGN